ncbi:hypothetical protein P2W68_00485 [Chryseobacterium arthrosphaerae]|nr:hypothetical protein [Chryseobacterium arthrosphaerae]WES98108.1 hypothetical protein P2W68_00485 [Chryseobacterium arthrosphaerae]
MVKEFNLLSEEKVSILLKEVSEIQRMIYSFKNNLK